TGRPPLSCTRWFAFAFPRISFLFSIPLEGPGGVFRGQSLKPPSVIYANGVLFVGHDNSIVHAFTGIPMNLDQQRLCIELQHLDLARELTEDVIQDIAASAQLRVFQAGQIVIELDSQINSVYFVVAGRLEGALFDRLGKEIHSDTFQRGTVVGLFSVLLPERS